MDYEFKVTTHGRSILAACMDSHTSPRVTRVDVGSGVIAEGVNLADQHELINYVAPGAIADRHHENDRFYMTVQYANSEHPNVDTFFMGEFIVYAIDPDTGNETDMLYATLGSYIQPVPKFNAALPASIFDFPLVIVISNELEVSVEAPAGLVTHEALNQVVSRAVESAVAETKKSSMSFVIGATPPAKGPALWFCSDREWRPEQDAVVATAVLGDPAEAESAAVTGEVNDVVYPVINATVSEEGGQIVATIEES